MTYTYQLYWGPYLQWSKEFEHDWEAIDAANEVLPPSNYKWKLVKIIIVDQG